ncbi:amino acid permease-domain-containing protein [Microdochium trichocladiopsis]|uniref:Amino acid permease-domain-containing protein n=1 Tax=Microdochium trichocladiopsis TaxID=1682393 RepID=A0A9P8Y3P1_9PEZI|nr:amino acid permease-domain-containing protein [Microdochium trichocladiopsis]KAH7026588.1 amino acid permease-domain-containing protein [Microdochium trichocladiopsis]
MEQHDDHHDFGWMPDWLPRFQLASDTGSTRSVHAEELALEPRRPSGQSDQPEQGLDRTQSQQASSLSPSSADPARVPTSSRDTVNNEFLLPGPSGSFLSPSSANSTHTPSTLVEGDLGVLGSATASGNVKTVVIFPSPDRTVKRELRGSHLFMITINATLGTGLYWKGGQILQLGGPLVVLLSFLLIGILAWAVMQCITEMLCIWPVPGALSLYVSEFVDVELGIAVGITYWFTYSVSFAAIIVTAAAEVHLWSFGDKVIDGTAIFLLVPVVLTVLNALDIKTYGWVELVTGSLKVVFLGIMIVFLLAISGSVSSSPGARADYWDDPFDTYDKNAVSDWFSAFLLSMSIVAFSYVGIEIVAASALEVRWPKHIDRISSGLSRQSASASLIGTTVRWSSIWIPVLVCFAYTLCGVLISFNIRRDDCSLPRFSWAQDPTCQETSPASQSSSAFVAIAAKSGIPHLANVFNAFLVFTAVTCAMTNLYVASRSMFGLATRLDRGPGQPLVVRIVAWFGKTNRQKVPMRAMIFSSMAFIWVPFLNMKGDDDATSAITIFVEVLGSMGTAGVFIVWACECLAFLRFYYCIKRHHGALELARVSQVRRWNYEDNDYPYRSHGQPFTAYMGLAGCLALLVVCNMAYFWKQPKFHVEPFLSNYLIIFVFLLIWIALKLFRGARWALVDLSDSKRVVQKLKNLHDLRQGAM